MSNTTPIVTTKKKKEELWEIVAILKHTAGLNFPPHP
jgi:hypothetical protein